MGRERDRKRIRTDEPALWQLIFPVGRKIFRTGCLWLQNILATCLPCASQLKVGLLNRNKTLTAIKLDCPPWNFFLNNFI